MDEDEPRLFRSGSGTSREIENLTREGARIACATTDFPTALARFSDAFPTLAPGVSAGASDGAARRALGQLPFRALRKRVPRPGHGFRPSPLPLPNSGRNAPCPCGSGQKYKQCCARLEGALPLRHLSPEEPASVAGRWMGEGRADGPPMPGPDFDTLTPGGGDEASYYRTGWRRLRTDRGALDRSRKAAR